MVKYEIVKTLNTPKQNIMYKTIFLFASILTISFTVSAQSDSLIATIAFGGYEFEQNGKFLTPMAMLKIMESDPEAYPIMLKAKANSGFASILAFSGGFLVGYPVAMAIGGGEPNWSLAGAGAGLIVIAIPLSMIARRNAILAVDIYNSKLSSSQFDQGIKMMLGLHDYGIGLAMKF